MAEMTSTKSINNVRYEVESNQISNEIKKLRELFVNVPHSWLFMDPNPTRYRSFVVDIKHLDNNKT